MLKIAIIQRFLPSQSRGGVGHFTHGLCNALVHRNHDVVVFSQDPVPADALYKVVMLSVPNFVKGCKLQAFWFPFQVAAQDFSSFDIIHAQGDNQFIRRFTTPPVIRTLHGSALAEAIHNGLQRLSCKHFVMHIYFYIFDLMADLAADKVIGVSKSTRHSYPRVHAIIPNGIDINFFAAPQKEKSMVPSILFVGELYTRKRGDLLLQIFRNQIKPAIPDSELWLICPEKVQGSGIKWWGSVSAEHLAQIYQQAWIFCLPSSYEGFGRPYAEAMAAGTPVVATPNSGAREVLNKGQYGLLVRDSKLGQCLLDLLGNAELRERYSRLGIERSKIYDWSNIAEQYEKVYENVIQNRRSKKPASV